MNIVETPLIQEGQMGIVEKPEPTPPGSQPAFQPLPPLNEADVRAAILQAEANGEDPTRVKVSSVAQIQDPQQPPKAVQAEQPVEVPEKFRKSNGEVDVEKLNASTKQLDEAIQKKQEGLQDVNKFVEEQLRAYKEKERQLSSLPNPNRLASQVAPQAPVPQSPSEIPNDQIEAMINQDLQRNPARTIASLVKMAIAQELEPINEEKRDTQIRGQLRDLAERDSRVVAHIAAINAKIDESPELRNLKNPYKAAWLEVKEDLRLGESAMTQAQPSKPVAPVLGGGTPPPAPSSSTGVDLQTVLAAAKQIGSDPRNGKGKYDPKQWEKMDAVARQLFNK